MGTEEELIEIIATEMYEVGNEGVFNALSEKQKEPWLIDAGYIADAVMKWSIK